MSNIQIPETGLAQGQSNIETFPLSRSKTNPFVRMVSKSNQDPVSDYDLKVDGLAQDRHNATWRLVANCDEKTNETSTSELRNSMPSSNLQQLPATMPKDIEFLASLIKAVHVDVNRLTSMLAVKAQSRLPKL